MTCQKEKARKQFHGNVHTDIFKMDNHKCSDLVHWENLEGMGGEGGGRGDWDGEHM